MRLEMCDQNFQNTFLQIYKNIVEQTIKVHLSVTQYWNGVEIGIFLGFSVTLGIVCLFKVERGKLQQHQH